MVDDKQQLAEAILESRGTAPAVTFEEMKEDVSEWLAQLRFPDIPGVKEWSDCIRLFPPGPDEESLTVGVKVRLAFQLYTSQNQYLVSVMECLKPEDRDVYILAAHVNWKSGEWEKQKKIDEAYGGRFVDALRGRHTVWTQTFRKGELHGALDAAAIAILGHELVGTPPDNSLGAPIKLAPPINAEFPLQDDE
jgi:hypothetical protein